MKIAATTSAFLLATSANANPFAPKVTKNTAKANYIGNLMRGARVTENSQLRHLEEEAQVDITGYSIKFEKCQFVKQYAGGQNNNNNGVDTILATKRFAVFRLCPNNSCSSCSSGYGEYIVDLETYLESTLQYKGEIQENYCQACEECAAEDEAAAEEADDAARRRRLANVNCNTCYNECQNIANMEANGYMDAAEYTQCQKVYENENTGKIYYAGAMCASSGARVKIGLFLDEDCSIFDGSAEIDKYLKNNDGYNVKLSYHLLKQTFPEDECVASCTKVDENANNENGDEEQEVEVSEVCENLYYASGKCEQMHGFVSGIEDYENYDNQLAQEDEVCDFIASIRAGTFDQTGDIVVTGGRSTLSGGVATTGGQKFALTFFIIGTAGLGAYAFMLHQQLTKGSNADLSDQGGALA